MIIIKSLNEIKPYITLDGSLIYEYFNPGNSPLKTLSIALAVIEKGEATKPHIHTDFDEIYYIIEGSGIFKTNTETIEIKQGDAIYIPKGTIHYVEATKSKLKILCICTPPYTHKTTKIINKT